MTFVGSSLNQPITGLGRAGAIQPINFGASIVANADSTAVFTFSHVALGQTWTVSLNCATAPDTANFTAYTGASDFGSFRSSNVWGPLQLQGGDQLIVDAVGLVPGETYQMQMQGSAVTGGQPGISVPQAYADSVTTSTEQIFLEKKSNTETTYGCTITEAEYYVIGNVLNYYGTNNFTVGETVYISGMLPELYNGVFTVSYSDGASFRVPAPYNYDALDADPSGAYKLGAATTANTISFNNVQLQPAWRSIYVAAYLDPSSEYLDVTSLYIQCTGVQSGVSYQPFYPPYLDASNSTIGSPNATVARFAILNGLDEQVNIEVFCGVNGGTTGISSTLSAIIGADLTPIDTAVYSELGISSSVSVPATQTQYGGVPITNLQVAASELGYAQVPIDTISFGGQYQTQGPVDNLNPEPGLLSNLITTGPTQAYRIHSYGFYWTGLASESPVDPGPAQVFLYNVLQSSFYTYNTIASLTCPSYAMSYGPDNNFYTIQGHQVVEGQLIVSGGIGISFLGNNSQVDFDNAGVFYLNYDIINLPLIS